MIIPITQFTLTCNIRPWMYTMCEGQKEERRKRRKDMGGVRLEFRLFACCERPKPSCPVLTSWQHHLLISLRSLHRLTDEAAGQGGGGADGGVLGSVVQLLSLCLPSVVSEQRPIKRQWGRSGFSESEKEENMGTKREQEEEVWIEGGGEWSCLCLERREGPKDMTDYRQVRGQGQCPGLVSWYKGAVHGVKREKTQPPKNRQK